MSWSINMGRIFDTEVHIHLTFFFLLVWLGTVVSLQYGAWAAADAITIVVLLFVCVVLHEFGHALVARKFGIKTSRITLWPIGGVASLDAIPEKPREEIAVALAGPAVNLVLAAIMIGLFGASFDINNARLFAEHPASLLDRLATINVVLAVFNLIPAFPMDGGRVLRAALAYNMSYARATRAAAHVGQAFGMVLAFLGLLGNPFLVLIGIFVYLAANVEAYNVTMRDAARGHRVPDVMISRFEKLSPDATLVDAKDLLLKTTQQEFPIVDLNNSLLGFMTREAIIKAVSDQGQHAQISNVFDRNVPTRSMRSSVDGIVEILQRSRVPAVGILDDQGRFVGYITRENVMEMLMIEEAARKKAVGKTPDLIPQVSRQDKHDHSKHSRIQ